jgi:putative transposase
VEYRRDRTPGATYFFTVVTHERQDILCLVDNIQLIHGAFNYVNVRHPFVIDAYVILPDHLHTIWTLPVNDADYSTRWRLLKSYFSHRCTGIRAAAVSSSRRRKQEKPVWQRRYWEHRIRDDDDMKNHVNYIHYNPIKHGLVDNLRDWPYSSFHQYVEDGVYSYDWGSTVPYDAGVGHE